MNTFAPPIPQPKTGKALWIGLAVIGTAGLAYFVFGYKGKDGLTAFQRLTGGGAGEMPIEEVKTPVEPVPAGSPAPSWIPEGFPLSKGMYGGRIKNLQTKLRISADGKFGSGTESAVRAKLGKTSVSEADYNKIVNPVTVTIGGGSNFETLKKNLGSGITYFNGGLKVSAQGKNAVYYFQFYTNGRWFLFDSKNKKVKQGSYEEGGTRMIIDGAYGYFENGGVRLNMKGILQTLGL